MQHGLSSHKLDTIDLIIRKCNLNYCGPLLIRKDPYLVPRLGRRDCCSGQSFTGLVSALLEKHQEGVKSEGWLSQNQLRLIFSQREPENGLHEEFVPRVGRQEYPVCAGVRPESTLSTQPYLYHTAHHI